MYILSKYLADKWQPETFAEARAKAGAILVDYVDLPYDHLVSWGVDCHISTSYAGTEGLRAFQAESGRPEGQFATVLHNFDVAVDGVNHSPDLDSLSICYLGNPRIAPIEPEFESDVAILNAETRRDFSDSVTRLGGFNCHYCVRKPMWDEHVRSFRPFTKGITAAALNAVIITNRQTHDAETLLGEDYPFMLDNIERDTLIEGMRHLRESFGKPEWTLAKERVRELKSRTTHRAIAGQLHHAIQSVI